MPREAPQLPGEHAPGTGTELTSLADAVAEAERRAIAGALERNPTDLAAVAEELGVSPTTLWRKMKRLGIRIPGGAPL